MRKRLSHCLKLRDLFINGGQVFLGDRLDLRAFSVLVFIESEKIAAILNREPERPRAAKKGKLMQIGFPKGPIAVAAALRAHQPDILVIADSLWWYAGTFRNFSDVHDVNPPTPPAVIGRL